MLDLACILFSTLMCLFVAFRAVILDAARPWFAAARPSHPVKDQAGAKPGWRGRPAPPTRTAR